MVYKVTAEDGSYSEYTVTVIVSASSDKDIITFTIAGQSNSVISGTSITVTVPYGTDVTSLVPSIGHTGVSISPESGVSGDFSNPVTYTVTDGADDTKEYTVTVVTWFKTIGGSSSESGHSVYTDVNGNVYVTGQFSGTVDFGGGDVISKGGSDVFIVKYSPNGVYQWARTFGGGSIMNQELGSSICTDSDGNVYVTGTVAGSVDFGGGVVAASATNSGNAIFVVKYAADGTYIWGKIFGGSWDDFGKSITADNNGNIYVTGACTGTNHERIELDGMDIPFPRESYTSVFIVKFTVDGIYQWLKAFKGNYLDDSGNSICTDSSGNVLVTGWIGGTVDFGGGSITAHGNDIFIAKFSSNGVYKWAKIFGGTGTDSGNSICIDKNDDIYVTGNFYSSVDFGGGSVTALHSNNAFILKYTSDGEYAWSKTYKAIYSESEFAYGYSVCSDSYNNVYVTGSFKGTANFGGNNVTASGRDVFLAKYSSEGIYKWSKILGGSNNYNNGYSTHIDLSGQLYVTGSFGGTIDFGDGDVTSSVGRDIFLIRVLNE